MGSRRRRWQVEPTDEWERLKLLCRWPEQSAYEEIRPLVLFGLPVAERAEETGSSERTLYRRISRFESEGMEFAVGTAKPRTIARPVLLGTALALPQPRLFGLESLGEGGWLKALRLGGYASRKPRPGMLQQDLFAYHEAWG